MIVKIKNDIKRPTEEWFYCEGDTIKSVKIKGSLKNLHEIFNQDTIYVTTYKDFNEEMNFTQITVYKNMAPIQWIVTNHKTYLMNSDGKTIDRIVN